MVSCGRLHVVVGLQTHQQVGGNAESGFAKIGETRVHRTSAINNVVEVGVGDAHTLGQPSARDVAALHLVPKQLTWMGRLKRLEVVRYHVRLYAIYINHTYFDLQVSVVTAVGGVAGTEAGEELADLDELLADLVAGNDGGDGKQNHGQAEAVARTEHLAEDADADNEGRNGLEGAENGGLRRADDLDGGGGAEERDDRGEQAQGEEIAPEIPLGGQDDVRTPVQADEEEQRARHKDVEGDGERGDSAEAGVVDPHNIYGVGQGGGYGEGHADKAERGAVALMIQQQDAQERDGEARDGQGLQTLVEEQGHHHGDEDGVDEEDGRGDAGIHVVVALEQRHRRQGHEDAEDDDGEELSPPHTEAAAAGGNHGGDQHDAERVAEEQHRVGIHAVGIERKREQGVQAVGGRARRAEYVAG